LVLPLPATIPIVALQLKLIIFKFFDGNFILAIFFEYNTVIKMQKVPEDLAITPQSPFFLNI